MLRNDLKQLFALQDQYESLIKSEDQPSKTDAAMENVSKNVFIGLNRNGEVFIEKKERGFIAWVSRCIQWLTGEKNYDANKSFVNLKEKFDDIDRADSEDLKTVLIELKCDSGRLESLQVFRDNIRHIAEHVGYKKVVDSWKKPGEGSLASLDLRLVGNTPGEKFVDLWRRYTDAQLTAAINKSTKEQCNELLEQITGNSIRSLYDVAVACDVLSKGIGDILNPESTNKGLAEASKCQKHLGELKGKGLDLSI
ncbi:MAG: hypothetical protein JSR46_04395 [Verrucomicrobia bacterium]|nr:hypothetical protein [Verrucomicrobiota bacterium]